MILQEIIYKAFFIFGVVNFIVWGAILVVYLIAKFSKFKDKLD